LLRAGIPFFTTTPFNLDLASASQEILGDRLISLQAGNEPDLYDQGNRNHRPQVRRLLSAARTRLF
jgi:hypothetical protein